ncbi:MAG: hypothetical protein AMXMBFR84_03510 [Candidatus Hydrogenedentota bacterium]
MNTSVIRCLLAAGLVLSCTACVSVRYKGESRAPVQAVDEYNAREDVKRAFVELGTIEVRGDYSKTTVEGMKARVVKEAAKRGANGVIYTVAERRTTRNTDFAGAFEPHEGPDEFREPDVDEVWLVEAILIAYDAATTP